MPFVLVTLIGILLIFFNFRAIKKEKNSFNNILNDEVDNIEEYKILLGETKREFTETIFELQKEFEELNKKLSMVMKDNDLKVSKEKVEIFDEIEDNESEEVNLNKSKVNQIESLFAEGMDVDGIAERLSIGKGEVLLIKELYLK